MHRETLKLVHKCLKEKQKIRGKN